ncbi:hypothetical protein OOK31_25380 [Streptomyces sp. NBC_00249]|uniref:hypothetical protein n=1 Tax=Streptomyces sp. NBC_00249 TaxID=2975690 RepID=UPI002255551C|nr:hypothetical protein [Streptomyces sp. NBC_00249]MCX5197189.1 hypothetical protein [Streptomyces sp. NBC_00249]
MNVRADIAEMLRQGLANHVIARRLHTSPARVQQAREALGIPNLPLGPRAASSVEELFAARTEPLPGGHLKWTGTSHNGACKVRWQDRHYSAHMVAFRIRTGRDPIGRARTSCDMPGCVAPAHVSDQAERVRDKATYNALFGGLL